jgi:tetratricopeptide (TPR) repeat protein
MTGLAVVAGVAIWQPWKNAGSATTVATLGAETKSTAPLSEARQLTLKARQLIDDDLMAVRENFRLAEELCQRAVALAPDDGEAWATLARVSNEMLGRRYETSTARKAAARSQAERAIRLAPDSVEAGLAQVPYFSYTREWAELERRMRALHARAPTDGRVLLVLAQVLNDQEKDEEATEIRLNHPAFAGRDPRGLLDEAKHRARKGRMAEMEALIDRAQALAPSREAYHAKLMLLVRDSHFLESARPYVEKLPPQLLLEDAFASQVAQFWIRRPKWAHPKRSQPPPTNSRASFTT